MKLLAIAAIYAILTLTVPSSPAAAQGNPAAFGDCPEGCWMCWNLLVGGDWYHNHNENGDLYGCVGSAYSHLGTVVAGRCLASDGFCSGIAAEMPGESEFVALVRANAVIDLMRLQQQFVAFVQIDRDSRALRLVNCDGVQTASVPLSDTFVEELSNISSIDMGSRAARR